MAANLWRIENDKAILGLHRGQSPAWRSVARFPFISAGTQGGKTSFGPWWLMREIDRCGEGDYLAVTASYDLFKLKMLPEMRIVFENVLGWARYWAGEKVMELKDPKTGAFRAKRADDPMWGRIILRSAQSSGGLEAATAKAAWLDECGQDEFTLEDWEAVQRRLSLAEGRALGTTTPFNLGWLKTEVYDAWKAGDSDFEVINFPSTVNPAFPQREYDRMKNKMQDWRFGMFYDGVFTRPAGLIYAAFTDAMVVKPFPIPLSWPRRVGVDFGGANTATIWLAQNPDTSVWYAYHETLEGGKTSKEHAESAQALAEGCENVQGFGGARSEGQQRLDWKEGGFRLAEPPVSDVESGIDKVTELIKSGVFRVFSTLKGLRDELGSYKRKIDPATQEATDEIQNKRNFHRLDGLRYAVVGLNVPGPASVNVELDDSVLKADRRRLWD
jgi:hypothetical protein